MANTLVVGPPGNWVKLFLQELLGQQDPKAKQSDEGSGGDNGFHGSSAPSFNDRAYLGANVLQRLFQVVKFLLHLGGFSGYQWVMARGQLHKKTGEIMPRSIMWPNLTGSRPNCTNYPHNSLPCSLPSIVIMTVTNVMHLLHLRILTKAQLPGDRG